MKRKLLTILLLTTLSLSLISCEKKVVYTGDPDVDAEIQEMWEEELENDSYDDLEDSDDITKIKINNSYLVSTENKHYLVLDIKTKEKFTTTKIRLVGENEYGEKKELCNSSSGDYVTGVSLNNKLKAPFKYGKNKQTLILETDWDGYDTYSIEIYTNNLGSSEYHIDSSELKKFSQDDFIEYMTEYVFDTTEETNFIEFDGIQLEYLNIDINEDEYKVNFNVKNISNLPTDSQYFKVSILPKNDIKLFSSISSSTLEVPSLTPGEEQNVTFTCDYMETIENLSLEPGNEFLIRIVSKYTSYDQDVKYCKIKL